MPEGFKIIDKRGSRYLTPQSSDAAAFGWMEGEDAPVAKRVSPKDALTEEGLKQFFGEVFAIADDHRRPREAIWDTCWDLYNNKYDFSKKAWWQHRIPVPKVRPAVDRAAGLFRKTLLRLNPFFGVQAESRMGRLKGQYTVLLMDYWYDQIEVVDALTEAFRVGLITSVAGLKIWWQTVRDFKPEMQTETLEVPELEFGVETGMRREERKTMKFVEGSKGKLAVAALNPKNIWKVPGINGVIERTTATLHQLESLAENGVYDKKAIETIRDSSNRQVDKVEDRSGTESTEGEKRTGQYVRSFDLYHYYGDIYNSDGRVVIADGSFTLIDKMYLVRKARPIPFFHRLPPIILGTPYRVPFSTYDRGMVEDVAEIAKSITEMSNLVADGALYDAIKAFAVDVDQLDDPTEAKSGVYPGKTFIKKGNLALPGSKLVETIDVGSIPTEAMNMIAMEEKYFQEGSYINEFVGGMPGRGGKTLGEVNIKTSQSLEGLDESAWNLETTLLNPFFNMSGKVIYQYHDDYMIERLMDNYPQISVFLQGLTPEERYATMVGEHTFKTRGLSIMVDRAQKMGEVKEILTLMSYLPGLLEQLNGTALLEEIFTPLGWNIQRLLLTPPQTAVTTPQAGAVPRPNPGRPAAAPPDAGGTTPMQKRNAAEGARMGGARNNPAANPAALMQMIQLIQRGGAQ